MPPALTNAKVTYQTIVLLGEPKLAPCEITLVILQRYKPAPPAAGEMPFVIHFDVNTGVPPRRKPRFHMLITLLTERITNFSQRKGFCLLTCILTVISHTGFTKIFHDFGEVFFTVMIFRCHS